VSQLAVLAGAPPSCDCGSYARLWAPAVVAETRFGAMSDCSHRHVASHLAPLFAAAQACLLSEVRLLQLCAGVGQCPAEVPRVTKLEGTTAEAAAELERA
jgi:hypothetical protein